MIDPQRIAWARRMRRILFLAAVAGLLWTAPSRAFVFGEPLPTLPPIVTPGKGEPNQNPENPPGGGEMPGDEEPAPVPTDLPPVVGGENPPSPTGGDPPDGGVVDDAPPQSLPVVPEPGTLALGAIGIGLAALARYRRRA